MTPRVVITGAGSISPCGNGVEALVEGVEAGRSALVLSGRTCVATVRETPEPGSLPSNAWRRLDRSSRLALVAAQEAVRRARLKAETGRATALVIGTMTAGLESLCSFLTSLYQEGPDGASPMRFPFTVPNAPASQCSILLGLAGANLTISEMEASGLAAIATAAGLVRDGACEVAVAGGVDESVEGFHRAWERLRLVFRGDPNEFRGPFDRRRRGFAPGEGAHFVVLERLERAERRGVPPWAEVAGEVLMHAAGPAHGWPADADAAVDAMALGLAQAGLRPEEVGYVAASANGSRTLDALEARAIRQALGKASRRIPVTSVKGAIGESGSASAATVIVAARTLCDRFVPPVAALRDPDPDLGLNCVVGRARRGPVPSVLINALGTGGCCAAVVLKRPDV